MRDVTPKVSADRAGRDAADAGGATRWWSVMTPGIRVPGYSPSGAVDASRRCGQGPMARRATLSEPVRAGTIRAEVAEWQTPRS